MQFILRAIFALLALSMAVAGASAAVDIPLCGTAQGFAGELNFEFVLTPNVEVDRARGESIIVAARPVPFNPNDPSAFANAIVDARFSLGNETFRYSSGADGLLSIVDAMPMGTPLYITVRNARHDGPTPFVLYSYVSNKAKCFLEIGTRKSFLGPIPVGSDGRPGAVYFYSAPPSGVGAGNGASSAFRFAVTSGSPVSILYAASAEELKAGRGTALNMAAEVTWPRASPVYYEVRASFGGTRSVMTRAVVEWRLLDGPDDVVNNNGAVNGYYGNANNNANANGNGNSNGNVNNNAGQDDDDDDDAEAGSVNVPAPQGSKMGSRLASASSRALTFVGYAFVGLMVYMLLGALFNYKVRHIHTFPEIIPHYEGIGMLAAGVGSVASTVKRKASRSRGGYSGVNSADMEDA